MREATDTQRSSLQSSLFYSLHFESADPFCVAAETVSSPKLDCFILATMQILSTLTHKKLQEGRFFVVDVVFVDRKQPHGEGVRGGATRWRDNVTLCCTDAPFITSVATANSVRRGLEQPNLYRLTADHARVATVNAGLIMASL